MPRTTHAPATTDITGDDVRMLIKTMSNVLNAIADGTITVDGHKAGAQEPPKDRQGYRPTIKEMRALGANGEAAQHIFTPKPSRRLALPEPNGTPGPAKARREYELAIPDGRRIDTSDLSASGVAILKYLSVNGYAAITTLMKELDLKRSTVANVLTELRRRKLVVSRGIGAKE